MQFMEASKPEICRTGLEAGIVEVILFSQNLFFLSEISVFALHLFKQYMNPSHFRISGLTYS